MVKRSTIKILIYQALVLDTDLSAFYTNLELDITNSIFESGMNIASTDIQYPAIRFKIINEKPLDRGSSHKSKTTVTFDIYFESRKETTDESDELIRLVRAIFDESFGRALGILSEQDTYKTIVDPDDEEEVRVRVWNIDEIANDQFRSDTESKDSAILRQSPGGEYVFSFLRYQMDIADYLSVV